MPKTVSCLFQAFIDHVKNDHSMWAYILFFIHLNDTKMSDYTAVELYVFNMVRTFSESMHTQTHRHGFASRAQCNGRQTYKQTDRRTHIYTIQLYTCLASLLKGGR